MAFLAILLEHLNMCFYVPIFLHLELFFLHLQMDKLSETYPFINDNWTKTKSPLEMKNKNTGQMIYFRNSLSIRTPYALAKSFTFVNWSTFSTLSSIASTIFEITFNLFDKLKKEDSINQQMHFSNKKSLVSWLLCLD